MANYNLTNQSISSSFQQLLQKNDTTEYLVDGTGSAVDGLTIAGTTSGSFSGDGSNLTGIVSASHAVTALVTASVTDATVTFTKGDAETFNITVDNVTNSTYAQNTITTGKNLEATEITKGTPLYFTGSGTEGNLVGVYRADAGDPTRMPAGGVAGETIAAGAEGTVLLDGYIGGVDTSTFASGDEVFVAVGGGYTNVVPTGSANLIQHLGHVEKSAVNGSGVIQMMGEARGLPNIQDGYVWVGNGDDVPTTVSTGSFGSDISSLNAYTTSNDEKWSTLGGLSGSFAYQNQSNFFTQTNTFNVGNTFNGEQVFNTGIRLGIADYVQFGGFSNTKIYNPTGAARALNVEAVESGGGADLTLKAKNNANLEGGDVFIRTNDITTSDRKVFISGSTTLYGESDGKSGIDYQTGSNAFYMGIRNDEFILSSSAADPIFQVASSNGWLEWNTQANFNGGLTNRGVLTVRDVQTDGGAPYNLGYKFDIGEFTASLSEGYVWVGDSNNRSYQFSTSSFITDTSNFATLGSNTFNGNQVVNGTDKQSFGATGVGTQIDLVTITGSVDQEGKEFNAFTAGYYNYANFGAAYDGAFAIEKFDSYSYNFGSGMYVSGRRVQLDQKASGSGNLAILRLEDLRDGTTRLEVQGDQVNISNVNGENTLIGNDGGTLIVSASSIDIGQNMEVQGFVQQTFDAPSSIGTTTLANINNSVVDGRNYNRVWVGTSNVPAYGTQYEDFYGIEYYDSTSYNFGSEFTINGYQVGFQCSPSGSGYSGRAYVTVVDNYDGSSDINIASNSGKINIETVMKLAAQDPLPGGSLGELAVSGSNLYFHNGTSWSQIN